VFRVRDNVIGGEQAEDRGGMSAFQQKCREADGRRSISGGWFGENVLFIEFRDLSCNFRVQMLVGNNHEILRGGERKQASNGLLHHRLLAVEGKQLLGALLATQRPESRAAASGENHGVKVGFGH
jgi:hypothetical protein